MWPFRRSRPSTSAASAPRNAPPTNAELSSWDPASRLVALADRIYPRFDRDGVSGLNEVEHTLIALYNLDNDVCNGGFGKWLLEEPLDLIRTTPDCLERVKEEHVLHLVRCIFSDLDDGALALDYEQWMDYVEDLGDQFWARINAYDLGFNAVEEHFIRRVWEYAEKHFREVRT